MSKGSIVIIGDVVGSIQEIKGNKYKLLCSDGVLRTLRGKPTEVVSPHALALLYYTKVLERIHGQ